jgi:hypothetical protein
MDMAIIIPTRGRIDRQITLQSLSCELRKRTTLVCPEAEAVPLACRWDDVQIVEQPDPDWTISRKRAWIMRTWLAAGYDKIIMLDDDLSFATRISENDKGLRNICGEELIIEFERLANKLGPEFPHVGFGQRQGNNNVASGWKTPTRMTYSLGYYLPIVVNECELGRIETREDMDITLQLLRKGYPNAVWNTTATDQRGYAAPGGCTNERTMERSNADAHRLAALHPGYVRIVDKPYKASVPRKEVVCQWQRALQDGLATRGNKYCFPAIAV